ncbi:PREDICTED: sialic acid-binding Ig-like lectin 10-like [Chrysochloris asiatica]|uniref:Sialic acid-binding Ig-like lectin 10-like n=1 Tax=Chrysochloris asiatica TaxID=185453 RepID=A0A9B0TR01_CHRAS|nr:PREDICTED: sialic acid-binding Ig-like lectin 10-like [Chrysochloris asiatica]
MGLPVALPSQIHRLTQNQTALGPVPLTAEMLVLLLLLWRTEYVGSRWPQAGADTGSWSRQRSQAQDKGYKLQVQESVTVQEGLCISIPCNFSYPQQGWIDSDPVHGYWFRRKTVLVVTNNPDKEVKPKRGGQFQFLGNPQTGSCSLVIINAHKEDTATYFFRVERGDSVKFSYLKSTLSLNVTNLTQKPDVYIPETLESEQLVKVLCVFPGDFEGCPAPNFSWTGAALYHQEIRPRSTLFFSELTLTRRPQDHDTELTCRVDFSSNGVSAERTVQLKVAYAPKDVVIRISRGQASAPVPVPQGNSPLKVQKGEFLQLFCVADGHPPATLSWVQGNRTLSWSPSSGPRVLNLELSRIRPREAGRYTCRAENRLGSRERSLDLSVQYPPENLRVMAFQANGTVPENFRNDTSLPVLEGQSLRLVCLADSNPPATLSWTRRSGPLSPLQTSDPGVLDLARVQEEDEGEIICRAQNPLGSPSVSLRLSVIYPPQLLVPSCSPQAEGLLCSCSARGRPDPSLSWRVGDTLVEGNNNHVTVTVTSSETWANSSLIFRGELSPDLTFHCEARNDHGAHSLSVLMLPGRGSAAPRPGGTRERISPGRHGSWCNDRILTGFLPHFPPRVSTLPWVGGRGLESPRIPVEIWTVSGLAGSAQPFQTLKQDHKSHSKSELTGGYSLKVQGSFLRVKTYRKKATKVPPLRVMTYSKKATKVPAVAGSDAPLVLGTVLRGHRQESQQGSPRHDLPPAVATPASGEDQELHYASLVFQRHRFPEIQDLEADRTTEYSEIKVCK